MVTQAFRNAFYPQESDDDCGCLLLIEHESFTTLRLTNLMGPYDEDLNAYILDVGGEDYEWVPFDIEPPGEGPERQSGRISVPDVSGEVGRLIDRLSSPPSLTLNFVLRSDPTIVVSGPWGGLLLKNFSGTHTPPVIQADIVAKVLDMERFPKDRVEPRKYRAVARAMS